MTPVEVAESRKIAETKFRWLAAISRAMVAMCFSLRAADSKMALLSKRQHSLLLELADELHNMKLMQSDFELFDAIHTPEKLDNIYRLSRELEDLSK